ncbi:MAG: hypothetical protein COV10_00460 [Candidatus Vogelbacteria bacterium CG10_big_fil_rev_8_21_14_0_10_51_16]|uniref:UPF0102 protein COV10_00460 n=1 Tax=Candidatus Vogelbacteria bacterium CG10_big_fil_rev_8_21_14_0_10_51_16 TaxID=1975045 RepID=A0A2H0RHK2_9BACT|nr:MAG: hypothetical protein COV10_00460 [Candidatus Vogelbacteria bacterium CG10_big_fil_rev_8_21_14_0_10_51_16]
MKTEKQKVGDLGEEMATLWLKRKGFKIIARNYRRKWGELDVVARLKDTIHFVEVKSVRRYIGQSGSEDEYEAEENIHPWKLRRLHRIISIFLENENLEDLDWQLDVIVVELDDEKQAGRVRYLEDVG